MNLEEARSLPTTLNADEVADLLGIGRNQAYAAAKKGEIPSFRIGGRVIFPTAPILELLGLGPPGHEKTPLAGGASSQVHTGGQDRPHANRSDGRPEGQ